MDRDKKRQQEQQERIFTDLLKDDANLHCADCGARGPKWASWNIGVFLCIRCGGVHRKLGTHISKVKSITLDTWTPEQIDSIRSKGNAKANLLFNPNGITPPRNPSDRDLENYIRDKYERKVFMSATSRATLAATAASASASSSSHASHSNSHSHSHTGGSAAAYTQQLRQLHDMGFTHDPFNIKALDQAKGNVQAAVEIIISMGPPPASAPTPSTYAAPRPAANTNAFFKQAPAQFDSSSPAMRQLKGMGFTDEPMTLLALQKADGNLDAAILWLTEKADQLKAEIQRNGGGGGGGSAAGGRFDQTQYAQQFLAQQQQHQGHPQQSRGMSPPPQQQQQQQKPKNDLLDLFGDGDPFASAAPAQPAMQPYGGGGAMGMMGGMGGMMQQPQQQQQQQPFGNMGGTPNPFGGMQPQQHQHQQPANPFAGGSVGFSNTGSSGGGSAPNPFGDFVSATPVQQQQQQQQQQRTGTSSGGAASDILSLYSQPKPQQQAFGGMGMMQQPQAQQGMMMGGMMGGGMQPQQQQQVMMGGGGMGMQQHPGMMHQPQQQMMMGGGGMQANPFGGAGMGGGMMMGGGGSMPQQQQQQQQAGFGNMGMGGMGMSSSGAGAGGNYSMVSTPFNAAQQPKSTPSPFGAPAPAAATPDPFAGLGNMAAFGQTQQKPASANNTNPFM